MRPHWGEKWDGTSWGIIIHIVVKKNQLKIMNAKPHNEKMENRKNKRLTSSVFLIVFFFLLLLKHKIWGNVFQLLFLFFVLLLSMLQCSSLFKDTSVFQSFRIFSIEMLLGHLSQSTPFRTIQLYPSFSDAGCQRRSWH